MDFVECTEDDNIKNFTDCRLNMMPTSLNCDHMDDIWLLCEGIEITNCDFLISYSTLSACIAKMREFSSCADSWLKVAV